MTETTRDRLVWVEIPATDLDRAKKFYEAVLETKLVEDNNGPQTMQMADVYVGAQVVWGTQFETLPKRDSFVAYAKRVTDRDAYKSAKAVDEALIAEIS